MFPKPQARLEEKNERIVSKPISLLLVLSQDTTSKTSVSSSAILGYFTFRLLERKHPKYTLQCLFYSPLNPLNDISLKAVSQN